MRVEFERPFGPPQNAVIFDEATQILIAKFLGAIAGSIISIAYILPRGRREAAVRLCVGFVTGLTFGGIVGVEVVQFLDLEEKVSAVEVTLMGAALSSLSAWWGLGVLQRLAERLPGAARPQDKDKLDKKDTQS